MSTSTFDLFSVHFHDCPFFTFVSEESYYFFIRLFPRFFVVCEYFISDFYLLDILVPVLRLYFCSRYKTFSWITFPALAVREFFSCHPVLRRRPQRFLPRYLQCRLQRLERLQYRDCRQHHVHDRNHHK